MRTAAAWSFPCGGCFCPAGREAPGLTSCACLASLFPPQADGLRHPASAAPCLRIAGRGPNNSSLLPPLAALVVVAVGSAAVRIRPWICFEKFRTKEKLQHLYDAGVLGGRGWITQAAHLKRPRRGLFAAGTYSGGRCCSNPPAIMSLMFMQKKTASVSLHQRFFHGAKQPKSEPLPSGASLAAISSKVMVFVPSL